MSIFFQNLVFPNPNPNPKGFDMLLESFKKKAKKINCEMTNHVIKPPPYYSYVKYLQGILVDFHE